VVNSLGVGGLFLQDGRLSSIYLEQLTTTFIVVIGWMDECSTNDSGSAINISCILILFIFIGGLLIL